MEGLLPGTSSLVEWERGNKGTAIVLGVFDIVPGSRFAPSALRRNMMEAGVRFAAGEEAHHIVAEGLEAFQSARDLLKKLDIKLDEAVNGAKLDRQFHREKESFVHKAETAKAITERLVKAAKNGADAVRAELSKIGKELEKAAKECTPQTGTRIC